MTGNYLKVAIKLGYASTGLKFRAKLADGGTSPEKDKMTVVATVPLADLSADPDDTGLVVEVTTARGKTFFSGANPAAKLVDRKGTDFKYLFKNSETLAAGGQSIRSVSLLFGSDPLVDACVAAPYVVCENRPGRKTDWRVPRIAGGALHRQARVTRDRALTLQVVCPA